MLIEFDDQDFMSSEVDLRTDIAVIKQKIPELKVRHEQMMQKLEQQQSIIMTKYMLNESSKTASCTTGQPSIPFQYCGNCEGAEWVVGI